jgi:yeast amino acid transporter
MIAYLPIPGGHISLADRFVDSALSFTMGWGYWYAIGSNFCSYPADMPLRCNCAVILPAELSAAAVLIGYWNHNINPDVWIAVTLVVTITINMLGAGAYGETEFIFAYGLFFSSLEYSSTLDRSIKIVTIVGLLILGIVLDLGGELAFLEV